MAVGYTSDIGKFMSNTIVRPGYHGLLCIEVAKYLPKKESSFGNVMFVSYWKVLTNPENQNSIKGPQLRNYVTLPLNNLEVKGHEAPKWSADMSIDLFTALWPEDVPDYPRFSQEHQTYLWKGEAIAKDLFLTKKAVSVMALQEKAMEVWGNDGELLRKNFVNQRIFCESEDPENDLQKFPNMKTIRANPDPGWILEDDPLVTIEPDLTSILPPSAA